MNLNDPLCSIVLLAKQTFSRMTDLEYKISDAPETSLAARLLGKAPRREQYISLQGYRISLEYFKKRTHIK